MFSCRVDDNIELRLPQTRDVEEITAVVRDNLDRLKPWMPWATDDYSAESARGYIQRTLDEFASDGRFSASIVQNGKIVGSIGFHNFDNANRSAHIGYWIARDEEGKGIVTRCCKALIDHLFDEVGLNRVQINCITENTRSRAIPERLGFKLEGVLRQAEYVNGRFGDWAIYSLLRDEWKNRRS
ncbi:MAG: GNAT family protein [Pyrinomonadaceae bacterium]